MQDKICNVKMQYVPSMSSDTGVRRISPVNSQAVFLASMPDVPSNTWKKKVERGRQLTY